MTCTFTKCAQHTRKSNETGRKVSWCGEGLDGYGWHFTDASHALLNGQQRGRLLLCSNCAAAMRSALQLAEHGE